MWGPWSVHGELLVTPSPGGRHQYVLGRMAAQVRTYLDANGLDGELRAPADISFDGDTLVQPDMFVADLGTFTQTWNWADIRTFHLVVEVVSPSTAKSDRTTKRRLYQQQRVPEYRIVDTDQRHVEVWTPAAAFPVIERECPRWQHPQVSVECEIGLMQLFAPGSSYDPS